MDELADTLGSCEVTPHSNTEHAHLYKSKHTKSSQDERRVAILEARKV